MVRETFYEYRSNTYGDGILLDEYRNEFSLVAAKRKDGEVLMEWVFPQKKDGSRAPLEKSLPWKIRLGPRQEAIKVLRFFLAQLEGASAHNNDVPDDVPIGEPPSEPLFNDEIPF